jgi:hypothetical protein
MMEGASGNVLMLVGSALGFMLAAFLLAMLGAFREWIFRAAPRLMTTLKSYPNKRDAEQNHGVYTELVEARALADSDRSMVLRFHNGNEFLPDNPVWKVTCSHEVVRSGVSYVSSGMQAVLVSRVHSLVDTVMTGDSVFKGVRMVDCEACKYKDKCDRRNKHSVVVQVDEMEDSFSKFMLESHNVKTLVASGMVSGRQVVGMVVLDFCDRKLEGGAEVMDAAMKVCRTAARVQYYLQFKTPPDDSKIVRE